MPLDIVSTRLRLPTGLHRKLTHSAKKNKRSLNSEILWRLAHSLSAEGDETAPKLVEEMGVEQRRFLEKIVADLIAGRKKGKSDA